ncbi:MAG: hypothetical protein QM662_05295 [Gordonia sp. (in: high G+C Gram-positive bacteria)]
MVALAGSRLTSNDIVGVDTSGERALSHLLGAKTCGDLGELATQKEMRERRSVDHCVDFETRTGVACIAPTQERPVVDPEELEVALHQLHRRFRGYVVDVPSTVATSLMQPVLGVADFVVAVTAARRVPDWVFHSDNPLKPYLSDSRLCFVHAHDLPPAGVVQPFNLQVPAFALHAQVQADGRWNLPVSARGLDLSSGDVQLTKTAIEIADVVYHSAGSD